MMYKYLTTDVVAKIDDDGISRMSCSIENEEFKAWLAEGNTPEPADPIVIPVPEVTAVQIRLELNKQNLRTQVEAAIAAGSQDLKDKWQYGNIFSSTDSDIQAMATSLGLTQEQLDTLFTKAATL